MDVGLLEAARSGNTVWFDQRPNLDDESWRRVTPHGNSALHIALRWGHENFAKKLSDVHPPLLAAANLRGETPLYCAVRAGLGDAARHFLGQARNVPGMLEPTHSGDTALHEAIRGGHVDVARALFGLDVAEGVHPPVYSGGTSRLVNTVNIRGESPLYLAAGKSIDVVGILLSSDAVHAYGGPKGRTALHAAVLMGHLGIVEKLLKKFPGLNVHPDDQKNTALHYAASQGSRSMVELLLKHDTDIAYLVDEDGVSPLHVAAIMGYVEVIEIIVQCCPECVDITDAKGKNALHAAVGSGKSKVVKYMLTARQFEDLVNQPDKNGDTPLHLAAAACSLKMVRILSMDRKVDVGALNHEGYTALDIVRFRGNSRVLLRRFEIISLLRIAGAKGGPMRADIAASHVQGIKNISDYTKKYARNVALVAVLITTITFAAAFTLPGGFRNNPPNEGEATLGRRVGFKVFLISDTVAMCCSATVAFLYVWTVIDDRDYLYHNYTIAEALMWVALLGTVVAFATGVYTVISSQSLWLAVLVCAIGCSVPLLVIAGAVAPFLSIFWRLVKRTPDIERGRVGQAKQKLGSDPNSKIT